MRRMKFSAMLQYLKARAKSLKKELKVIYLAYKRPDVPWYAKLLAALVIGYALSPVDLIPDFIPVFGYLDDLVIIPLGITLVVRLIPKEVLEECRAQSGDVFQSGRPKNWAAGALVIGIWVLAAGFLIYKLLKTAGF